MPLGRCRAQSDPTDAAKARHRLQRPGAAMKTFSTDELEVDEIVQPARARKERQRLRPEGAGREYWTRTNPMNSARVLRTKKFTSNSAPTLWRHRGCFLLWTGSYFARVDEETIRTYIWTFLEKAKRQQLNKVTGRDGRSSRSSRSAPTSPRSPQHSPRSASSTNISTRRRGCRRTTTSKPPAGEFFACANGLLHLPSGKLHAATPNYFCLNASAVTTTPKRRRHNGWHSCTS